MAIFAWILQVLVCAWQYVFWSLYIEKFLKSGSAVDYIQVATEQL